MYEGDDSQGKPQGGADRFVKIARVFSEAQNLLHRASAEQHEYAITTTLQRVGRAMGADRAYIFQNKNAVSVDNTHEWCAKGIRPLRAELQHLPYHKGDPFWQAFRESTKALMLDIRTVPAGSAFHKLLEEYEIKALINASLWCDGDMIGLVGLHFSRDHREFTELEGSLMQGFAASVGLALNLGEKTSVLARTQSELRLERARVEAMISAMPELLVETDNEGTIVGFNQSDPLVFAQNPNEVIGRPPETVLPPAVASLVRKAMKQVDLFGWSPSLAYTVPFPTGDKRFTLTATKRHHEDP